jgi:hypothetical protein
MNRIVQFLIPAIIAFWSLASHADSASLLSQAQADDPPRYQFALTNNAEIRNTSDNKAFTLWWQPSTSTPTAVIVTLHGHGSYATDEFYLWQPYAQARGYAILALQWWFGGGETTADYYLPEEMYPIIASLLTSKGVQPGAVLFHGYSRGSANSYAMTALDASSGNRFFAMTLSNSGGATANFPPNMQIVAGTYGLKPFSGMQWVMYCGEKDPDPTINGCPAMTASKEWVTKYGATVKLLIDDPNGDHGGFMTNSTNVTNALAQFAPTTPARINLLQGWNLIGNGTSSSLDVTPLLADTSKVNSAWKWVASSSKWAFYSPAYTTSKALSDYAASKSYDVLTTINGGEGFWINAKSAFSLLLPNGSAVTAATVQSGLTAGWNLVAIGETKEPSAFDASTLWAWDSSKSAWYLYSQTLNANGTLSAFNNYRGYLDFATNNKKLGQGEGFWVNKTVTATAATTTTTVATTTTTTLAPPSNLSVSNTGSQTVGSQTFYSSTKLNVSWTAPGYSVDHYEITATESIQNTQVSTTSAIASVTLSGLKAATSYGVTVKSCANSSCSQSATATAVTATTSSEYWQLQGSGATTAGLTRIVSDGNVRISATRIGSDAGTSTAGKIQLYYGPNGATSQLQALSTAITASAASSGTPSSYLSFTSSRATTGLISPATSAPAVQQIATGQGVPLSASLGSKVRLFFEAKGSDNKTRIYYLDSQDGYVGQDFNSGSPTTCSTTADYSSGGGCVPNVVIGVEGDSANANSKISNARQFKLGFPILSDWRWDGATGTFMVFTTDSVTGCSTSNMNHGYAVWSGTSWVVQYESSGCPKLFKSAQAAFPMHLGGVRFKLYYGDPSVTTGKTGSMPFLGPKKLIFADGAVSGSAGTVDFEDWESQTVARDVVFLWPNGEQFDSTAEGYIDDYHFLAPTASLDLQVMYLAITNGTEVPFGAAAILLNP